MGKFAKFELAKKIGFPELMRVLEEYAENGWEIPESAARIIKTKIRLDLSQATEIACLMSGAANAQREKRPAAAKSYLAVLAALSWR